MLARQRTILIIDSSADDRLACQSQLSQETSYTYSFLEATTGAAGLQALRRATPACVVLADALTDADGLEVLSAIVASGAAVPVILLTAQGGEAIAVQAFKRGARDYLVKGATPPEGLRVAIRNAIEQADLQRELLASEARFRASVETMLDCFGVYTAIRDAQGRIVDFRVEYVNDAACTSNMMAREEQIGRGLCELLPAHRTSGLFDAYCRLVETGEPLVKESLVYEDVYNARRLRRAFDIRAAKLNDGFVATWRDITERKRLEEQVRLLSDAGALLAESLDEAQTLDRLVRMVVATAADACAIDVLTADGSLQRIAAACADPAREALVRDLWLRYPPDKCQSNPVLEAVRSGQVQVISTAEPTTVGQDGALQRVMNELGLGACVIAPLAARGQLRGAMALGVVDGAIDPILAKELARRVALAIDNAVLYRDLQQALQSRDETLALFNALLMAAPVGFAFLDQDLRYRFINDRLAELNGSPPADHLGRTIGDMVPGIAASAEPLFRHVLTSGEPLLDLEFSGETAAAPGEQRFFNENCYPVRTADGRRLGVGVVVQEITERKQAEAERAIAEQALRESESRLRHALQAGQMGVWEVDLATQAVYRSESTDLIFGLPPGAQRRTPDDYLARIHPADREKVAAAIRFSIDQEVEHTVEYRVVHPDGGLRWVASRGEPVRDAAGRPIRLAGALVDVTARKDAEERILLQAHMLDAVGQAVIGADLEGTIFHWNRHAELLYGWTADEVRGRNVMEVTVSDATREQAAAIMEALRNGQSWSGEFTVRRRDGSLITVLVTDAPVFDAKGDLVGVIGVSTDITERTQAEVERLQLLAREQAARAAAEQAISRITRLQAVTSALAGALTPAEVAAVIVDTGVKALEAAAVSIYLVSADGQALELLGATGYPLELLQSWRRFGLDTPAPLAETARTVEPIWMGSRVERDARYPHLAAAYPVPTERAWAAIPLLLEQQALGAMGLDFDGARLFPPEERAFILALAQQCAQALERTRLYEAEQRARAQAETAVRVRDEFLSIAVHELKTPLTALLGNAQLLQRRAAQQAILTERDHSKLELIADQTVRLAKMIELLLDVSHIEMGRLAIARTPLDLLALVQRLAAGIQPTLQRHTLEVSDLGAPLVVIGDELRLEQVLQNLLQNAVKYSPNGGTIRVRVEQRGARVCVAVSDEGIGIPAAALPKLFSRFYRAGNAANLRIDGLGVGLYVVKEIVTLHGGTVDVLSREGAGSTFTICLPLAEASTETPPSQFLVP